ncbi:MAG: hypothetical protein IKW48_00960 [Akkermansia sp.]|nr:hypothetical protein [Akkermansia sp.]
MYTCKQFWLRWVGGVLLAFVVSLIAGMVSGTTELTVPCITYCVLAALLLTPVYTRRLADAGLPPLYWWIAAGVHAVWAATACVMDLLLVEPASYMVIGKVLAGCSIIGLLYCVGLTLVCGFKQSANNAGQA